MSVQVTNAGPEADDAPRAADGVVPQHVVMGLRRPQAGDWRLTGPASVGIRHPFLGELELIGRAAPGGAAPTLLFCENETNDHRLYGVTASPTYPKDGINDHVISGARRP